jgi:multidrug resistance efflux pump
MDASYAEQQRDRLMLRRQEVEAIASDARARLAVLDRQIGAELRRLQRAAVFDVVLPAGTAVWSQPVPRGSTVAPGATLIELVDCRRRYVEVALPERRMETLLPGERVSVRLVGGRHWQEGTVASALGGAARQEGAMTAAGTGHNERTLTVDVSLPPPATLDRRCEVGRLAEVRFSRWR